MLFSPSYDERSGTNLAFANAEDVDVVGGLTARHTSRVGCVICLTRYARDIHLVNTWLYYSVAMTNNQRMLCTIRYPP